MDFCKFSIKFSSGKKEKNVMVKIGYKMPKIVKTLDFGSVNLPYAPAKVKQLKEIKVK